MDDTVDCNDEDFPSVLFKDGRYRDMKLLLINIDGGMHGPIATRSQYENSHESICHLTPDGRIMRYGRAIGRIEDLEITGGKNNA